jgi:hypothetical protein
MYNNDAASILLAILGACLISVAALSIVFLIIVLICRHRQANFAAADAETNQHSTV